MTELLADDRVVDERSRRLYLDVMQSETSRLGRLVENLLDFGRMQANRRHYEQEPFDFTELVRDTVRDYGEEVQRDGYSLELSGDHAPTLVAADREAFRSVIRNLLENAVKYSPDSRTVWIETGRQNGDVVLNVRDRGIGVPANEQRRIFDRFVRGEAAKRACIQGTGIGLAMVREIVEAHHGRVTLISEPGVGSTFAVQVPLIRTSLSGA
jgi:signal transduction histidine kinase